jgi:hypothetical protein
LCVDSTDPFSNKVLKCSPWRVDPSYRVVIISKLKALHTGPHGLTHAVTTTYGQSSYTPLYTCIQVPAVSAYLFSPRAVQSRSRPPCYPDSPRAHMCAASAASTHVPSRSKCAAEDHHGPICPRVVPYSSEDCFRPTSALLHMSVA